MNNASNIHTYASSCTCICEYICVTMKQTCVYARTARAARRRPRGTPGPGARRRRSCRPRRGPTRARARATRPCEEWQSLCCRTCAGQGEVRWFPRESQGETTENPAAGRGGRLARGRVREAPAMRRTRDARSRISGDGEGRYGGKGTSVRRTAFASPSSKRTLSSSQSTGRESQKTRLFRIRRLSSGQ